MAKLGLVPGYGWAVFIGAVEFFGGLFVAFGFLTRLAAVAVGLEMLYIVFFVIWPHGYFWTKGGYEYTLMWGVLMIGIAIRGGGAKSLDAVIGRELQAAFARAARPDNRRRDIIGFADRPMPCRPRLMIASAL